MIEVYSIELHLAALHNMEEDGFFVTDFTTEGYLN